MLDTPAAEPRRIGHVAGLDGVRAVSVLSVILLHFGLVFTHRPGAPSWLRHVGPFALGVQMFFVLSGALITSLLIAEHQRTGKISLRSFYLRRWRRLGPTLVALVPLLIVVQLLWTGSKVTSPLGLHPVLAVFTVALFVGNWASFRAGSNLAWLDPAWSLGVEEQFYLSWPSVLVLCLRRRLSRRNVYVGLALAILVSVGIAALIQRRYGLRPTYFATPTQLPCILFGCALGYEITANPRGGLTRLLRSRVSALIGVLGTVVVGLEIVDHPAYEYRGGYVPFAIFGCLVVGHCFVSVDGQSVVTRVLSCRPLEAIGKVSYEIYLLHAVVILAIYYGFPRLNVYPMMATDLVLTVAGAALLYRFFDQPIRRDGWLAYPQRLRAKVLVVGRRAVPKPATPLVAGPTAGPSAAQSRIRYVPALDGMRGISLPGTIYTHFQIFLGFLPTAPWWIRRSGPFTLNIEMF
ncbi:MAG: acyltransferase family protein, partial [Mycobacteriales bacterium]